MDADRALELAARVPQGTYQKVVALLQKNENIEAIKTLRSETDMDLRGARDTADALRVVEGLASPFRPNPLQVRMILACHREGIELGVIAHEMKLTREDVISVVTMY